MPMHAVREALVTQAELKVQNDDMLTQHSKLWIYLRLKSPLFSIHQHFPVRGMNDSIDLICGKGRRRYSITPALIISALDIFLIFILILEKFKCELGTMRADIIDPDWGKRLDKPSAWRILPVPGLLQNFFLMTSVTVLTAFNDKAAIIYPAMPCPNFSPP